MLFLTRSIAACCNGIGSNFDDTWVTYDLSSRRRSAAEPCPGHPEALQKVSPTVWPRSNQVEQEVKFISAHGAFGPVRGRAGQAKVAEIVGATAIQRDHVINMEVGDVEQFAGIGAMGWLRSEPGFQFIGGGPGEIGRSTAHRRSQIAGAISVEIGLGGEGLG